MHDIEEMTAEIVRREDGFVNDPDDPGGATKYGVTIHTLCALRGRATVDDVKALTEAEAIRDLSKANISKGQRSTNCPRLCKPLTTICR